MYRSINVDEAVKHLKNIVDSIRCAVCDKTDGNRMRYACGHTSCEDCVVLAPDCSVCLTPPENDSRKPVVDKPFTQRAADAVNLLDVFQNEFHIDVYKRNRISEQLKVEKELFPDCIQAPAKYFNKRKSFNNSKLDKENRLSQLPGEEITFIRNSKMEKQGENVEMWLNKYVRKPFAELNSNNDKLRNKVQVVKKKQNVSNIENTPFKKIYRKRSHSKALLSAVKNQSQTVEQTTPLKKTKIQDEKFFEIPDTSKYTNNESGIVMDDEAVIVIDDSQSVRLDKDINACLAVQEAEQNNQNEVEIQINSKSIELTSPKNKEIEAEKGTKVPFYLKSYLSDNCIDCNGSYHGISESMIKSNNIVNDINIDSTKDVSITVENKSFITIIKIKQIDETANKTNCMQSVEVQTDTTNTIIGTENVKSKDFYAVTNQVLLDNNDQFENANKEMNMKVFNKTENIIIEESDSDEDVDASLSLEVTAEIHRSCEEVDYGILADIGDLEEHNKRARRAPRGVTPSSSNSSEKENFNPNRMKKTYPSKKKLTKK